MDKCVFCGGEVREELVAFVYDDEDRYFFVEHVPAEVCSKCGERNYSPEVTDELLGFARQRVKPSKTIKVPVFDFAEKA
jgi:YgiT-type zinc finger domain-containing protein